MPRVSNEKKIEGIKKFLNENNIRWEENRLYKQSGVEIPIFIPSFHIGIRIGDDQVWYEKSKGKFYPIFIREKDTMAFAIEKVQNTIIKSMQSLQKAWNEKRNTEQ